MPTVRAERTIPAPIEPVFELLTDHANYDRFRAVRGARLVKEGEPAPNGVGAVREVDVGPLHFSEEITAYEQPVRMDYLIHRVNMPFRHEGGSIRLEQVDGGTHAVWTSSFEIPVRAIGRPVAAAVRRSLGVGFASVLRDVERELTR